MLLCLFKIGSVTTEHFAAETNLETLRHDLKMSLAIERAVEIVGEAAICINRPIKDICPVLKPGIFNVSNVAGAEGLEPSTYGFGDRRSTN